mmetsp:Transcript_42376/g.65045  ORF Transcript_42376/g.65045 Transcript_42376/m.65045 type:complete len:372 (+) Transcript_42376:42-1157(+)
MIQQASNDPNRQCTYKEYLRECFVYKDFKELKLNQYHISQLPEAKKPKSQLCHLNFLAIHECIFGPQCQFAHKISDVEELISELENKRIPKKNRRLFKGLGIGASLAILSFFTPEEIVMNLRRVNKEALVLCKRIFETKVVQLEKITLKSVKFFERASEIKISCESLNFFKLYKDEFFEEVLNHYSNVRTLKINLNFLFDDAKKDRIIAKISSFALKRNIHTFQAEDVPSMSNENLKNITRQFFLQNVQNLKLPRNNLGNQGVYYLFGSDNLRHIKKIDLSSNNIDHEGAQFIAQNSKLPYLQMLDLRVNRMGDQGFKYLITSEKLSNIRHLKLDINKITQTGAVHLSHNCKIPDIRKLKVRDNQFGELGA